MGLGSKSPLKTNQKKLIFNILQNTIKTVGESIIKIGDRYFKVKELG